MGSVEEMVIVSVFTSAAAGLLFFATKKVVNAMRHNDVVDVIVQILVSLLSAAVVVISLAFIAVNGPEKTKRTVCGFALKYLTAPAVCCLLGLLTPVFPTFGGVSGAEKPRSAIENKTYHSEGCVDSSAFSSFPSSGESDYRICKFVEQETCSKLFTDNSSPVEFETLLLHFMPSGESSQVASRPQFEQLFNRYFSEAIPVCRTSVKQIPKAKFESLLSHFTAKTAAVSQTQ